MLKMNHDKVADLQAKVRELEDRLHNVTVASRYLMWGCRIAVYELTESDSDRRHIACDKVREKIETAESLVDFRVG